MSFQNGDPQGGAFAPSSVGNHVGEYTGQVPKTSLVYRKYYQETQPTIANSMGMHSLPPVPSRIPISDQYAIGVAHPDLSLTSPDPTIFKNINGNVSLGSTPEARRESQMNFRSKLQTQRRQRGMVIDG